MPPDMRVLAMADIYNAPTICIEHLRFNVAIARDVLPPVPYVQLPQAVCQLCAALRKVADGHAEDQLLAIAADGRMMRRLSMPFSSSSHFETAVGAQFRSAASSDCFMPFSARSSLILFMVTLPS